ncbi:MAG: hypothetical protein JWM19_4020 [Actinomycetia bacterium]|nr:hypothetical protein [Actinomycetes bacterium]
MRQMTVALIGIIGCALLAGCGTRTGTGTGADTAIPPTLNATQPPGVVAAALPGPIPAVTPHIAAMPHAGTSPPSRSSATPTTSPSRSSATPTTRPATPSQSASGSGSQLTTSSPPGTCRNPQYSTSAQLGMWNLAPYFVYNDMWNVQGYQVSQTLYGCSYSDWYVVADMNNDNGDGHVKTYPNSHRDFDDNPAISAQHSITATFAESSPDVGIYEDAFDIELNYQQSNSTEVMVWTHNHGQTPGGTLQGSVTIDGSVYQEYRALDPGNTYIALVAQSPVTSGTVDLLAIFEHLMQLGWIAGNSTLHQVCFGAEIVSTGGTPQTFSYSNFSVNIG